MLGNVPQITTKYREYVSINFFIKDGTYLVANDFIEYNNFSHDNNFNIFQEVEDSEGVKECKDMQGYLIDAGVPINLDTLYRSCSNRISTILRGVAVVFVPKLKKRTIKVIHVLNIYD